MTKNIKLVIEYDGTNYCGWQRQKNALSIQQVLETKLERLLKEKVKLTGSGRTDSGVHARCQVANFKTNSKLKPLAIKNALNAKLPRDIIIRNASFVSQDFHAQFDAKSKIYRYSIYNKDTNCVFCSKYIWWYKGKLDIGLMEKEAKVLLGKHDFSSFQAKDVKERSSIRTIKNIFVSKKGSFINITVEANGFLYNMVRNIAGTLVEIGRYRFQAGSMKAILAKKDRKFSGPTAPASGLCLVRVRY